MKRTTTAVAVLAAIAIASATGCPGAKPAPAAPTAAAQDVVTTAKATIEQWRNAYEARSLDSLSYKRS